MICADFLAGVGVEGNGNNGALVPSLTRLVLSLPKPPRTELIEAV